MRRGGGEKEVDKGETRGHSMVPRRDREQSRFLHGTITVAGRVRIERELDLAPVCSRQGRRNNYRDAPPINQDAHLPFLFLFFARIARIGGTLHPPFPLRFSLYLSPPLRDAFLVLRRERRERVVSLLRSMLHAAFYRLIHLLGGEGGGGGEGWRRATRCWCLA